MKCNLCGNDDYAVIYAPTIPSGLSPTVEDYTSTVNKYGFSHRLVSCRHCGLVYANPRDEQTVELYRKVVDKTYLESWEERAATFREHLKILSGYNSGGHDLLDLGCYAGIFLDEAKKLGYNAVA